MKKQGLPVCRQAKTENRKMSLSVEEEELTRRKQRATQRLVNSFAAVPTRWIQLLAEYPEMGGQSIPTPMWGAVFIVPSGPDTWCITNLLRDIEIKGDEDKDFVDAGWKDIGNTGILAIEFDDNLVLGIHGAGYDFYEEHWSSLYDELGYQWHNYE